MGILADLVDVHDRMMKKGDPRMDNYPLMSSPIGPMCIIIMYVIFVYKGPDIMKDRQPMDLKPLLILYNFLMVYLSFYLFLEFGMGGWFTDYSYGCQPVDYSNSPKALRMANAAYWFGLSKYIELTDTVFFILRKKNSQITFLHVFHHGFLPVNWWLGIKYVPGGFGTFHGWVNAFVHSVMYLYYGLSALGAFMQKYLWWKKYLTGLQISQFIIVVVHTSQIFFFKDCDYPPGFAYAILIYTLCFFVLFVKFYIKTYATQIRGTKKDKAGTLTNGRTQNEPIANGTVNNGIKHKIN